MKKILIFFVVFQLVNVSFSQTIEETIDYINALVFDHQDNTISFDLTSSSWVAQFDTKTGKSYLTQDEFPKKYYHVFSVNERGLLTIKFTHDVYLIPAGLTTVEASVYIPRLKEEDIVIRNYYIYLKQLSDTVHYKTSGTDNGYRIYLKCTNSNACINRSDSEINQNDYISLMINGLDSVEKLKNAFEHLIKLAKENPDYWENDPFAE